MIPSTSISRLFLIALALATSVAPTAAQSTTGEREVTTAGSSSSDTPLHLRIARAYNDPARWDMEQLAEDTERRARILEEGVEFPLTSGAHPIPEVGTPGLGIGGFPMPVAGKRVRGAWGLMGHGEYSAPAWELVGASPDQDLFVFSIFILTDDESGDGQQLASSRSRPHFVWMGSSNRGTPAEVEWTAFHSAGGDSYAMVNGRLFDLRAGRAIWVAPMADGSIRYFQDTEMGFVTEEGLGEYIQALPERADAIDFFGQDGAWR